MKAILISIQPKWCELMASGKKTVEVRKTKPKLDVPFKVYIYETQGRTETPWIDEDGHEIFKGRGKVIGEFVCNNIDQYDYDYCPHPEIGMNYDCGDSWWEISDEDLENACLTYEEFKRYAWRYKVMYGWNISNLVIYDKPKDLTEFYKSGALSLETLLDFGDLCQWCSDTNYGEHSTYGSPNGSIMCEGRFCDKAYQEYLDENYALTRPPQSWCYVESR